jgi:2-polyprenyl-3-methyl-5-hydroxy-6-metoxy-1,4-benzoquinol methylase
MSTTQAKIQSSSDGRPGPSPEKFFETMVAYQRTAALRTAIELDLFTAIGDGQKTVLELAKCVHGSERGVRILCDGLAVIGFLTKTAEGYGLTADSAVFLDRKSQAYMGSASRFLASSFVTDGFENLPAIVRAGHPLVDRQFAESEHPAWTEFARSMAPLVYVVAQQTARLLDAESEMKVLDVAAGHGMFGIAVAHRNPKASVVALDWPSVLAIAQENAERTGIADRYQLLAGDAREIDFGESYDAILIPNLLHMWDRSTNERFLKKVYSALAPRGRAIVVELAPNDDRTSPAIPALFALNMLANTSAGDAYTVSEYCAMLNQARFPNCEVRPLLPTSHTAFIATRLK